MRLWFTVAIVLILIWSAHKFGRGPERLIAHLLGASLFLSIMNYALGLAHFSYMNTPLAIIDGFTLIAMGWLAIRANRMWPLIVTALQLIVITAHMSVVISVGSQRVYFGMMALAQYLELIVLAGGIASHAVRERKIGRYRDWRSGYEPRIRGVVIGVPGDHHTPLPAKSQNAAINVAR